jgi:hypothetical protein
MPSISTICKDLVQRRFHYTCKWKDGIQNAYSEIVACRNTDMAEHVADNVTKHLRLHYLNYSEVTSWLCWRCGTTIRYTRRGHGLPGFPRPSGTARQKSSQFHLQQWSQEIGMGESGVTMSATIIMRKNLSLKKILLSASSSVRKIYDLMPCFNLLVAPTLAVSQL